MYLLKYLCYIYSTQTLPEHVKQLHNRELFILNLNEDQCFVKKSEYTVDPRYSQIPYLQTCLLAKMYL